jgi:hypothetical protein
MIPAAQAFGKCVELEVAGGDRSGSSVRNGGPALASLSVNRHRPINPADDHGRIALIVTRTHYQAGTFNRRERSQSLSE